MNTMLIDINAYCNNACEFCSKVLDGSKLEKEKILSLVKKYDPLVVDIGGGEPMMHKEVVSIVKDIREMEKRVIISTDGTFIPKGFVDLEAKIKENVEIQVSLHAPDKKNYVEICHKDFFDKVIGNINIYKHYFETAISMAVYKKNYDLVPKMIDFAEEMKLPININLVYPIINGKNVERLEMEEVKNLQGYLRGQRMTRSIMIGSPLIRGNNCYALEEGYNIERKGICPVDCGTKVFIDSHANEFACEFYQIELKKTIEDNIRKQG